MDDWLDVLDVWDVLFDVHPDDQEFSTEDDG